MKNKNAFTLVELLAVIAILAILVIIALPNVMGMFNTAKKNSFQTEVKQVFKMAQQQWINDSMFSTGEQEYGRCDGCSYKELDLTGRQELKYYIKIDKSGCVTKYTADDGTYRFEHSGSCLEITQITDSMITTSTGEELNSGTYVYAANYSEINIGSTLPSSLTTYSNYMDVVNATGEITFMRFGIENSKVSSVSIGFVRNGNAYYVLQGDNTYSANKTNLWNAFGGNCTDGGNEFNCDDDKGGAALYPQHNEIVVTSGIGWGCLSGYNSSRASYYGYCFYD